MKKSMLAASLLAALTWTAGAFAQSPVVNVTLVNGQIQVDPDPVNVERRMGRNVPIRWQIDPRADYLVRSDRDPGRGRKDVRGTSPAGPAPAGMQWRPEERHLRQPEHETWRVQVHGPPSRPQPDADRAGSDHHQPVTPRVTNVVRTGP